MLGVGSESVVYLPDNKEPPDLEVMPSVDSTGAMLPEAVAPELADSTISRHRIMYLYVYFVIKGFDLARTSLHSNIAHFKIATIGIYIFKS